MLLRPGLSDPTPFLRNPVSLIYFHLPLLLSSSTFIEARFESIFEQILHLHNYNSGSRRRLISCEFFDTLQLVYLLQIGSLVGFQALEQSGGWFAMYKQGEHGPFQCYLHCWSKSIGKPSKRSINLSLCVQDHRITGEKES